jgi:hypothetical protein
VISDPSKSIPGRPAENRRSRPPRKRSLRIWRLRVVGGRPLASFPAPRRTAHPEPCRTAHPEPCRRTPLEAIVFPGPSSSVPPHPAAKRRPRPNQSSSTATAGSVSKPVGALPRGGNEPLRLRAAQLIANTDPDRDERLTMNPDSTRPATPPLHIHREPSVAAGHSRGEKPYTARLSATSDRPFSHACYEPGRGGREKHVLRRLEGGQGDEGRPAPPGRLAGPPAQPPIYSRAGDKDLPWTCRRTSPEFVKTEEPHRLPTCPKPETPTCRLLVYRHVAPAESPDDGPPTGLRLPPLHSTACPGAATPIDGQVRSHPHSAPTTCSPLTRPLAPSTIDYRLSPPPAMLRSAETSAEAARAPR